MKMSPTSVTAAERQNAVTLKEAIDHDGIPPTPSSKQRRLMDLHVTASPGILNAHLLPKHRTPATDLSPIDPTLYRQNHSVKNNNVGSYEEKEDNVIALLTTSQMASKMMQLGIDMRAQHHKEMAASGTAGQTTAISHRGYRSRFLSPAFDERSTYRWDYCQKEIDGFGGTAHRQTLETYRDTWTADEKADVDASMMSPYLTMPLSSVKIKGRSSTYRKEYIPEAGRNAFRLLSHKTDLPALGTTFAYSAYGVDDERRDIVFDSAVASLRDPHSVLEKTFSPRASFNEKSTRHSRARGELDHLRSMQRETVRKSVAAREASVAASNSSSPRPRAVVIPGIKGTGYRRAPAGSTDYIFLPRDHFSYQHVDDY